MTTAPDTEQPDTQLRQRTFSWEDPVEAAATGAGMSGAEFFAGIAAGTIPPPPILRSLDFDGVSFGDGRAVFRLTPREFHYNTLGGVHGGVFATLLDSACGCAVHTKLPVGVGYTSLDLSVKFLRPVTVATGPITAEGNVVHFGRRTALAEARITDDAGKVYATATSSCLVLRPELQTAEGAESVAYVLNKGLSISQREVNTLPAPPHLYFEMHDHLHDHLIECVGRMHVRQMCWEWRWLRCLSRRLTTACQPPGWLESAGARAPTATRTEAAWR